MKFPKFLKRLEIISIFVMVASILTLLIINPYAILARNKYAENDEVLKSWQRQFDFVTMEYYEEMLKDGFMHIPDLSATGNKTVWETKMFPQVRKLYSYKLYINGSLYTGSTISFSGDYVTIDIEEFYDLNAEKLVPSNILRDYSYFRSKGTGILPSNQEEVSAHIDSLFKIIYSGNPVVEKKMNFKTEDQYTSFSFTFDYKDIIRGNNIHFSLNPDANGKDLISSLLNIDFRGVEILLI